jgi:hypothetical protein
MNNSLPDQPPKPERPTTFATADLMDAEVDAIAAARMHLATTTISTSCSMVT